MRTILSILLFFIYYQVSAQDNINLTIEDINNDGIIDTLKTFYQGGSSFGGKYVGVVNGKTNQYHELTNEGCYCDFKSVVLIPSELNKPENKPFLKKIKSELLPEKSIEADPSLDWMIRSAFSYTELKDHSLFDLIIDPKNKWNKGKLRLPSNYYLEIEGDTLKKLNELSSWGGPPEEEANKGYLIYHAHNHYRSNTGDSLKLSDSNEHYKVFNTSHGVLAKKGDLHKWLFVNDVPITGGPEKLRWESIHSVSLIDEKHILVQHNMPRPSSNQLFVINIETGTVGRLRSDLINSGNDYNYGPFRVQIDNVTIMLDTNNPDLKKHKLKDIFSELKSLSIN